MRFVSSSVFERTLKSLSDSRKVKVKKAIQLAVAFFETGDLPHGLGLKPLSHGIWEIRAGLEDRILFRRFKGSVEFILVGSHDEIRRFLKNI